MLKLFDLKKPGANNGGAGASSPRTGPSAAYLRLQKGKYYAQCKFMTGVCILVTEVWVCHHLLKNVFEFLPWKNDVEFKLLGILATFAMVKVVKSAKMVMTPTRLFYYYV
jgi:hypothetical protein